MKRLTDAEEDCIRRDIYAQLRSIVRTLEIFEMTEVMDVTYGAIMSVLVDADEQPESRIQADYTPMLQPFID